MMLDSLQYHNNLIKQGSQEVKTYKQGTLCSNSKNVGNKLQGKTQ